MSDETSNAYGYRRSGGGYGYVIESPGLKPRRQPVIEREGKIIKLRFEAPTKQENK